MVTRDSVVVSGSLDRRGANKRINGHVLVGFSLPRPALPRYPTGLDLVVGTNLPTGDLFSGWITGLAVTRLFGDVGLTGGRNWLQEDTSSEGPGRRCHPCFGLDFRRSGDRQPVRPGWVHLKPRMAPWA